MRSCMVLALTVCEQMSLVASGFSRQISTGTLLPTGGGSHESGLFTPLSSRVSAVSGSSRIADSWKAESRYQKLTLPRIVIGTVKKLWSTGSDNVFQANFSDRSTPNGPERRPPPPSAK